MDTFSVIYSNLVEANVPVYAAIIIAVAVRAFEITVRFKRKKQNNDE
jgi:hypothetical protein